MWTRIWVSVSAKCLRRTNVNFCNQCRIKVGAIDAVALSPFKIWANGHGRENEKNLLYFGCDSPVWYNFGKIIKTVATRGHILKLKCTKFDFG